MIWFSAGTLVGLSILAGVVAWRRKSPVLVRLSGAALYAVALIALGLAQLERGFAPARFFLWGAACDLAGFILVAALLGWGWTRLLRATGQRAGHRTAWLRLPEAADHGSAYWFCGSQAVLAAAVACLAIWIAADLRFDGMGQGVALFDLDGRTAACPAALMLLGTSILMAWQSTHAWRAGWQYAALAAGVLFTTSVGWASVASSSESLWLDRGVNLLISVSMMTLMTGYGLGRFLPRGSDWVARGRRAMPVFAVLALALLLALLAVGWFTT